MPHRPRSLKHEYELYVEQQVEDYKESVSRGTLLTIGDEAVANLGAQAQLALTELLLCEEVDRIIRQRLRIPSYVTWRRRRLKALAEFRRPERWGLAPDGALAQTLPAAREGHALVAGASKEGPALYLAAHGCAVTALEAAEEVVERVMSAAAQVGLTGQIRGLVSDLGSWTPDVPLNAVICTPAAFAGLSNADRARVFTLLQTATPRGGVHVVEAVPTGTPALSLEELAVRYRGWQISVERELAQGDRGETFLARKAVA
jgi:hypothetical protein